MNKNLIYWQVAGFIFVCISGVLLHFLYDFTNQNVLVALFSPVNESIWEHLKLLFFPMLLFAFVEKRYVKIENRIFFCAKFIGIILGLSLIPVIYYTINGVFGATSDWINIVIFFVVAAISFFVETKLIKREDISCDSSAIILLIAIVVLFVVWTFDPPHIPLFKDPVTGTYGIYME